MYHLLGIEAFHAGLMLRMQSQGFPGLTGADLYCWTLCSKVGRYVGLELSHGIISYQEAVVLRWGGMKLHTL